MKNKQRMSILSKLSLLSLLSIQPVLVLNTTTALAAPNTEQRQEDLKKELEKLDKLKSELQSKLDSAKQNTEFLKEKLVEDGSALKNDKIISEITKEEHKIIPIEVDEEIVKEKVNKIESEELTKQIKAEIITSELSESLADHLDYSQRIVNMKKDIEKLSAEIDEFTKSIDENKNKLDELVTFRFPARGVYTSMYGWRENPFGGGPEWHTGVDIAGYGDILSVLDGTVTRAETVEGYGNYVEVDHGVINGVRLKTRYAHLASIYVSVGQEIKKGSSVGLMGSTGYSTGVHLHFEVLEDGERTNPKPYLDKALDY